MISNNEAKKIINDLFKEEALLIGGLAAVHDLEDELVWRLIKNMDVIRQKVIRRIDVGGRLNGTVQRRRPQPHPAIEDFLLSIRRAQ